MQKWTRWQDWMALVAGVCAALSPLFIEVNNTVTWTMVALGVVTVAVALWSLSMPDDRISEFALVLLGVLFIASPWAMDFVANDNMALTAWIVGAVTAIAGVLGMPEVEHRMHHRPIAH